MPWSARISSRAALGGLLLTGASDGAEPLDEGSEGATALVAELFTPTLDAR